MRKREIEREREEGERMREGGRERKRERERVIDKVLRGLTFTCQPNQRVCASVCAREGWAIREASVGEAALGE